MKLQQRVISLLLADLRATEFVAAWAAFFAGVTFMRVVLDHLGNVSLYLLALEFVMPMWAWGAAFFVYAFARFLTSLSFDFGRWRCFISIVGMALWSSVFASGTILREAPSGLAILYAVPAAFEIWALGQALATRSNK
jgi:hypothetical protein